jgi:hypothetical protein
MTNKSRHVDMLTSVIVVTVVRIVRIVGLSRLPTLLDDKVVSQLVCVLPSDVRLSR